MNEKLKEIVSNISYKNYNRLESGTFWVALLFNIADDYVKSGILKGFNYATVGLYAYLVFSRLENHTKELTAINSAYNEIIDNYAKFMKEMELTNPIQIGTMHANMVEDGYLSLNNKFEFDRKNVYDSNGLCGVNIINGHGVCRHHASLLTDVLNKMEIDAFNLVVCFPDYGLNIKILDDEVGQTREEIYANIRKYFVDADDANQILEAIDEIKRIKNSELEVSLFSQKEKNIFKRIIGNHAICFAVQNGYGYYLDPTMQRIYHMIPDDFGVLCDDNIEEIKTKLLFSRLLNSRDIYDKMYTKFLNDYNSEDRETTCRLVDETTKLYEDNRDICDKFYDDNKEIYQSVSHNLSLLKTNIISRR